MNFYGKITGPQHTLFGRVAPLTEALRLALCHAVGQPLPAVQFADELPAWSHHIAEELTRTVFKGVVNMAPQGKKYRARQSGQMIGVLIRMAHFWWNDAPAVLKREGLDQLTPERKKKLEQLMGWEVGMAQASKLAGRPIKTKAQLKKHMTDGIIQFVRRVIQMIGIVTKFALRQPVEDVCQFLSGMPEGFKSFLKTDGELAKAGKRTEVFLALLAYWPEIVEMCQAQPPLTRKSLLTWLEKQEGKQLVENEQIFFAICDDISLDLAPPGHPRTPVPG